MLRLLLEKCNILHPSSMFQSFIDTSTTAGNGIDMSWFYSYKTPRQNVNIWLFTFTVKAKRGFFASFLCDVCMRACVRTVYCGWYVGSQVIIQVLSNLHKATNQKFTFICILYKVFRSLFLSLSPILPFSLPILSLFLHIWYLVYVHTLSITNFYKRKQWIDGVFV